MVCGLIATHRGPSLCQNHEITSRGQKTREEGEEEREREREEREDSNQPTGLRRTVRDELSMHCMKAPRISIILRSLPNLLLAAPCCYIHWKRFSGGWFSAIIRVLSASLLFPYPPCTTSPLCAPVIWRGIYLNAI